MHEKGEWGKKLETTKHWYNLYVWLVIIIYQFKANGSENKVVVDESKHCTKIISLSLYFPSVAAKLWNQLLGLVKTASSVDKCKEAFDVKVILP